MYIFKKFRIAMFMAQGQQTRLSRRGHSIVFSEPVCGLYTLSSVESRAREQIRTAGLDLDNVKPEAVKAYDDWCEGRRFGREAKFVISGKTSLHTGDRRLVPANRVRLSDAWGDEVACVAIPCQETPATGTSGSVRSVGGMQPGTDYDAISRWIASMRREYPEFDQSRVVDLNFPEPAYKAECSS